MKRHLERGQAVVGPCQVCERSLIVTTYILGIESMGAGGRCCDVVSSPNAVDESHAISMAYFTRLI